MSEAISIIIPTFRNASIVGETVRNALAQDGEIRVIVVDDASDDNTAETAEEAGGGDRRLHVIRQPANRGPAAARNAGLAQVDTDWVALLDSDDRMAPGRLTSLIGLATVRGWDLIADDLIRVADWTRLDEGHRLWSDRDFGEIELDLARFVRENIHHHCGRGRELGYVKPVIRTAFLRRHGLAYREEMRLAEDYDLYARALLAGARFGLVDPRGYYAFDTSGSLSKAHNARDLEQIYRVDREFLAIQELGAEARAALREHLALAHEKWAWARLTEAVRARRPAMAAACFLAPPAIAATLASRVAQRLLGGQVQA